VLALASEYRQKRLEKEHAETIKARHKLFVQIHSDWSKTQPINSLVIRVADLFIAPEVKAVFESIPLDQKMKVEDFSEVIGKFAAITERWAAEAKGKLFEMARDHLTKLFSPEVVPDSALDLAMASRAFICGCHRRMDWNMALKHREVGYYASGSDQGDVGTFKANTGHRVWWDGHFEYRGAFVDRALSNLRALGFDGKTVTAQALDKLDEIFECTACTSCEDGREMLDWRGVVRHTPLLFWC
jgi:hypothetical protein